MEDNNTTIISLSTMTVIMWEGIMASDICWL